MPNVSVVDITVNCKPEGYFYMFNVQLEIEASRIFNSLCSSLSKSTMHLNIFEKEAENLSRL